MNREKGDLRLSGYYYFVQISGIIVAAFFTFVLFKYPSYFSFFIQPLLISKLILGMLIIHTGCFILQEIFHKKLFYALSRYVWILFFALLVYLTGGVNSQFLFILFFPLLTAGTDLSSKETKYVGIFLVFVFGAFIFGAPGPLPIELVLKHITRTALFAVAAFYLHKMVKETLLQKYEKEETKRKFVELIELDQVKSDFITVASHQLRTPLSGIKWALTDLSLDKSISDSTKEVLVKSLRAVDKSVIIINELMSASENRVTGLELNKKLISLDELVESVISSLSNLAEENNVKIILEKVTPSFIQGDREKLTVSFENILGNAIRYSAKGTVTVRILREGLKAVVIFEDTGIGISEEDIGHVFDRFFRSKEAIEISPNETGLGLYIAKKIIEKHSGTIEISSKKNVGTKVEITLPL